MGILPQVIRHRPLITLAPHLVERRMIDAENVGAERPVCLQKVVEAHADAVEHGTPRHHSNLLTINERLQGGTLVVELKGAQRRSAVAAAVVEWLRYDEVDTAIACTCIGSEEEEAEEEAPAEEEEVAPSSSPCAAADNSASRIASVCVQLASTDRNANATRRIETANKASPHPPRHFLAAPRVLQAQYDAAAAGGRSQHACGACPL